MSLGGALAQALLAGAVLGEVAPERRGAVREHLANRAVTVAGWPQ